MKRILITGANSYLGKSLTEYLKQWPDEFQVEATSVRDDTWKETDFHFFDAIYHTAALVHMEQNKQDPAQAEFYDRVNARLPISIAKKAIDMHGYNLSLEDGPAGYTKSFTIKLHM